MEDAVLIVAHGQPSDPEPALAELQRLAEQVAGQLGRPVLAATLATGLPAHDGLVFPMFMAGGWFTRVHLAQKLAGRGRILEPFGCDPRVHDLAVQIVTESVGDLAGAEVLIAAHGSFNSPAPSAVARHLAARFGGAARSEAAFIDQDPRLADVAGFGPHAVCLPFFAAYGQHVAHDIPAALAGFAGRILPHLGADPRVPALIAAAIAAGHSVCAQDCRYSLGR